MRYCKVIILIIISLGALYQVKGESPILLLNCRMHESKIGRISTDADGTHILTVSNDKTAKLWDGLSGEMLKTLRPPIKRGDEGMLFAGALSPDGKTVAVAGWTSEKGNNNSVWLFNSVSGKIIHRLSGLENVVFDLEFSPDGRFLAVAMGGGCGVNIFECLPDKGNVYSKIKMLPGYTDKIQNIAFSLSGEFGSVCYDGYIRIYDADFDLKKQIRGMGSKPHSIAFSPNSQMLVVGYEDVKEIEVFDARTHEVLFRPKLGSMEQKGGFSSVAFSHDSQHLFGGGYYSTYVNGKRQWSVRKWEQNGQGSYSDYPVCANVIMDIKPISSKINKSDIIFAGAQPDFGRMDTNGIKKIYKTGELYNFSNSQFKYLRVNDSGTVVAFKPAGKPIVKFGVTERLFQVKPDISGLYRFVANQENISIENWINSGNSMLNGQKVKFLELYEICRSVDIAANGACIVWGTNWSINCTDNFGNLHWKISAQNEALAVNISRNGKIVVAALANGTLNWYRIQDGELLLTLYIHPETKKWVLFSPRGYYDAAPGGEDLIGWHVNNGADKEALFYPVSKFRSTYYRPDVIDNILESCDVTEAIRLANLENNRKEEVTKVTQMLPPVVHILSPQHNEPVSSTTIAVEYQAVSPGGESVTEIKFLVDGRPVKETRGFKSKNKENRQYKQLTIPQKDVLLQVMARNMHGWSEAADVQLKWKGQSVPDVLKPTLYILAIGVSNYQNDDFDLKFAAKDASDFTETMKQQKGGLYKDVVVNLITDQSATTGDILDGLDWIQQETTARDIAMIFLAGHGMNDNLGAFYYLPYEADLQRMRRTCIRFSDLKYTTSAIAGKVVAFVDACHSGDVMGGRRAPDVNGLVNELSDVESGAVVFTSSTGRQFSLEAASWQNGAFTKAVVEGLQGKADLLGKGSITVKSLDAYVAERVKELTDGKQSPTVVIPHSMPDFPIGIVQ